MSETKNQTDNAQDNPDIPGRWRITFPFGGEVTVTVDAENEDDAYDKAVDRAKAALDVASVTDAHGAAVHGDIDGVGASDVQRVNDQ